MHVASTAWQVEMERSFLGLIELSEEHCRELLDQHRPTVGRVAFADDHNPDWPMVLPVNYVWVGGDIYFNTFEGSKLFAALRSQRVAFEIDEVDDDLRCGWSVVVVGPSRHRPRRRSQRRAYVAVLGFRQARSCRTSPCPADHRSRGDGIASGLTGRGPPRPPRPAATMPVIAVGLG